MFGKNCFDFRVLFVPIKLNKKDGDTLDDVGLDLGQIDSGIPEIGQEIHQRSRAVGETNENRCFVVAAGGIFKITDDKKTGPVVPLILDIGVEDRQGIHLGSHFGTDRSGFRILGRQLRCFGRRFDWDLFHFIQPEILQKLFALTKGDVLGINPFDGAGLLSLGGKNMMDIDHHFGNDFEVVITQTRDGVTNDPVETVLNRHHTKLGLSTIHFTKDPFDTADGKVTAECPKFILRCLVREACFRPQESDLLGQFKIACNSKQFQKKRFDRPIT